MPSSYGQVSSLWRYPVSSMAGERLAIAAVAASGIVGDRLWGVIDRSRNQIAWPGRDTLSRDVPRGFARLADGGTPEVSADGVTWAAPSGPAAGAALSTLFGFPAELRPFEVGSGLQPRYKRAPIHLLTTASMRTLAALLPGSRIDERRFRPNVVIDLADGSSPLPETEWLGRIIRIGDVVIRGTQPCARCGFTTLAMDDLPLDVEVLRTITKNYGRNFGIYCDVVEPGVIRAGDVLTVAPPT